MIWLGDSIKNLSKKNSAQGCNPPNLCVLPWNHIFLSNEGTAHTCCVANRTTSSLKSDDGQIISAKTSEGFREAWFSGQLKEIRKELLDNRRPSQCSPCFDLEDRGLRSHRNQMNEEFVESLSAIQNERNISPALNLEFVDLRFGNLCNLACRMCAPFSSIKLGKEWEEFYGKADLEVYKADSDLIESILNNGEALKRVSCLGGEPFIIPDVEYFLGQLISRGYAKNIKLTFSSNMTVVNKRLVEMWPHFSEVLIGASIDGVGKVNDYIRYPSKWEVIAENLEFYRNHANVYLNTTVQIYNIFHLKEIFEFAETAKFSVKLNLLKEPAHLSIQSLPISLKQKAEAALSKWAMEFGNGSEIEGIIEFMFKVDRSPRYKTFLGWTAHLDRSRGQNFLESLPQFNEGASEA